MNWTRRSPRQSLELVRRPAAGRTPPRRLALPTTRDRNMQHQTQKRRPRHLSSARLWLKAGGARQPRRRRAARRSLTRGRRPMKWPRRGPTSAHPIVTRTGPHTTPRRRRRACAGRRTGLGAAHRRRRRSSHLSHYVNRARGCTARRAFPYYRPPRSAPAARGSPACCSVDGAPPRHRCVDGVGMAPNATKG